MKKFKDIRPLDYGTPESVKKMKGMTPGQNETKISELSKDTLQSYHKKSQDHMTTALKTNNPDMKKKFGKRLSGSGRAYQRLKKMGATEDAVKMAKDKINREKEMDATKHDRLMDRARLAKARAKNRQTEGTDAPKGPESYEAQYKRRLVRTTDPEHKKKGYNWRIKGKKDSSLTKKLYKKKPGKAEFNSQLKRIAGHEFG